jgi:hypothetical protein
MKIAIQGMDYSAALDAAHPLTIERKINEPSVCQLWLSLPSDGSLAAPKRFQYLKVKGDDGTVYFTGYIAGSPLPEYAGMGIEGPRYRTAVRAVSDEIVLDQVLLSSNARIAGKTAGELLTSLVVHSGLRSFSTSGLALSKAVSTFAVTPGANWSRNAGQAAGTARAAYRAVDGTLIVAAVDSTVHALNETDGSLNLANLSLTPSVKRALANDITVCGENEPVAYVTEYFLGDGVTTDFQLADDPYLPPSSKATIIHELFNEAEINENVWGASGAAGCFALGAGGLAMNGGNGLDSQTMLTWLDSVEMGGTLLLETAGITLSAGSTGILAGFFTGVMMTEDCMAGFKVASATGTGAVTLQPLVQGSLAGTEYSVNTSNQYTLRVRIHCPECERSRSIYYSYGDDGEIAAGGDWVIAPGRIQMDVQEFVNGIGATPVTLYDGGITYVAGVCTVAPASSTNLIGTMRSVSLKNLGSGWVVSTPSGGSAYTRRIGTTSESAECHLDSSGQLTFYTGYTPASGERIAVSYRSTGRAVGRSVNTESQTALAAEGSLSVAVWAGSVTSPETRSSADCRIAAQVMAQAAASTSALWSGTYRGTQNSFATDVWPGDALLLKAPSTDLNAQVVVRSVKVTYSSSWPDVVEYTITFANDWADDLAIKTTTTVPDNAWLPVTADPTVLNNLNRMTVTALGGSTVTVNTGVAPPTGGGFEIRLRDFAFMAGEDSTLVLRGSEQNLTFSRASASDRFYIRMYDGSTPPNYSEFSTALYINLPLSS